MIERPLDMGNYTRDMGTTLHDEVQVTIEFLGPFTDEWRTIMMSNINSDWHPFEMLEDLKNAAVDEARRRSGGWPEAEYRVIVLRRCVTREEPVHPQMIRIGGKKHAVARIF